MIEFISNSATETEDFALSLAARLSGNEVIAFTGDLGAGKTCFTRGLARGIGYEGEVTSPTFAIVNEYLGGRFPLYHFDMYRIESWEDLYSVGFFEYMENGIIAAEWSENIAAALPDNCIFVNIEKLSENCRKITVSGGNL
ncbi:MAG: tRNA (adenosine(37)-N6)-threonylcarbamoyltransferase complex ATPase subunit type 1 TsaE [Clostridia bacterium]|nr:tRNA (adenosine(37)-N6)-threonylcarbamoyltransferase complex ATPase subunit type 1 TsaE [Clostridia bacterium]